MLMGCDGIWECKSNKELIEYCKGKINEGQLLEKIMEQLLDDILAPNTANGTGCDNMTSILIVFKHGAKNN